ncbi:hypothetical protein GCM10028791_24680 [Echinicola sediminis]
MDFSPKKMVNWYDPKQLAFTGMKTVVSGIFGNFADKREIQAALDKNTSGEYDYSLKEEIWIDYISDLGDGFNATYTMAHLLAQNELEVPNKRIPRGDILIMGGDQVYPTPELDEYRNRLQGPYHAAFPKVKEDANPPDLFAIPGNHDWYDGLTNFLRIFCQKRSMGNWRTKQSRSYFALKLPHHHWLIALDIQLNSDIDYPQLQYFKEIAQNQIKAGDKIIIATAEPNWVYRSFDKKNSSHDRFEFFINNILYGKNENCYGGKNENIQISAILTGDLHHYARYEEKDKNGRMRQLFTAGGGGAFMHLTHNLKDTIVNSEGNEGTLKSVFPSKSVSKVLSLKNLLFPFFSYTMLFLFGLYHVITGWVMDNYPKDIINGTIQNDGLIFFVGALPIDTGVIFLNFLLLIGITLFSDTSSGAGKWNYIAGFIHGLLQVANFYWMSYMLSAIGFESIVAFYLSLFVFGGIVSGIIFGIYLLISVTFLDNHITEGSSSFRHEGYKNFLRIHISQKGLAIYPIGVKSINKDWKMKAKSSVEEDNISFNGSQVHYELIENPIHIHHEKAL